MKEKREEIKNEKRGICFGLVDLECVDLPRAGDLTLLCPSRSLFILQSTFKPPFIPRSPALLVPASVSAPTSLLTCSLIVPRLVEDID